ncbi:MAG: TIGR00303 family protein [Leptolyngbya sp. SIO4C1]|nr:TIGR00303 family protein [Leptolyngbya sp. SIO4C1]
MSDPALAKAVQCYGEQPYGQAWLRRYRDRKPAFVCILGFTETALIPHISAAGNTPEARRYTAVADAEFLYDGPTAEPTYALPPLQAGVSPAFITKAIIAAQSIPLYLFDAGLAQPLSVPHIALTGQPARCLSTGRALPIAAANRLFQAGWQWGQRLARRFQNSYLIIGECVVGGTTTAQAVLSGLGFEAASKVSSSHPHCNHAQKTALAAQGLRQLQQRSRCPITQLSPIEIAAAVGDPMQLAAAGLALAAAQHCGILLAGGSQMIAVYALMRAIAHHQSRPWLPENIVIGTTRWVVEDSSSHVVQLAQLVSGISLLTSQITFETARYAALQIYEQGFVKEGVGAGGCAIAAYLYQQWAQTELLAAIEALLDSYSQRSLSQKQLAH